MLLQDLSVLSSDKEGGEKEEDDSLLSRHFDCLPQTLTVLSKDVVGRQVQAEIAGQGHRS